MKITISAKKWFDTANGNTYHSVKTVIYDSENDINKVILHGMTYGYGNHFMQTAYQDAKRFAGFEGSYNDFCKVANVVNVETVKKRELTFDVAAYIDIFGAENVYTVGGLVRRSSKAFNCNLDDMFAEAGMRERAIINMVTRITNRNGILRLTSKNGSCEYSITRKRFTN